MEIFLSGGTASGRSDFNAAILHRRFNFPANQSSITFKILLTDDGFVEPPETIVLTIGELPAGYTPGVPSTAVITIGDNDPVPVNAVEQAPLFTEQHYSDFFTRPSDPAGFDFWLGGITACGTNQSCTEVKRINNSAAFFLSIEFQQTGYLVYRTHQAAFGVGPTLRLKDFFSDALIISEGVVVLAPGWQELLAENQRVYFEQFVERSDFVATFPLTMTPAQFVDALNARTLDPQNPGLGGSLSQSERDTLVNELSTGAVSRAQTLRRIVEDKDFHRREFNRAFVLMQYFGYLRRNPDDSPDNNMDGYDFWLTKLNQFGGDFIQAEMVKAFITSIEYCSRFGP